MFAMLCFLEDLGYMARVACMLDKVFKSFGLHGASVIPFIISGGIPGDCSVSGVMAARTLRSPKERLAIIFTAPFMVCGAKVTIFLMRAKIFFPKNATFVVLIITLTAWFAALIVSKILRSTIIKGAPTPFIMELPPYRLPTLYGIATHTWDRVWQFIKKAGTGIFAVSVIMWVLMTFPQLPEEQVEHFNVQRENVIKQVKHSSEDKERMVFTSKLNELDNLKQETALKYFYGGRMGVWLESFSKYAGFSMADKYRTYRRFCR